MNQQENQQVKYSKWLYDLIINVSNKVYMHYFMHYLIKLFEKAMTNLIGFFNIWFVLKSMLKNYNNCIKII